jgi:hypothetical protein
MRWAVILLAVAALMEAADVEAIRQTQAKLIAMRGQNEDSQGATPQLTVLKHQIRDWVESKLGKLAANVDIDRASHEIDAELARVKLIQQDDLQLGDIEGITLEHPKGDTSWLLFKSIVGLDSCGRDTSIYLYQWQGGAWTRIFELEHNAYFGKYGPLEDVESVEVSYADQYQNRLVLVLANSWGCASMWQSLSYSLFRIGGIRRTLLDESDTVYLGDDSYAGRLEPGRMVIQYLSYSKDLGVLVRPHVLRYVIDGDSVRRVEPIALTPQDFVDEWLTSKWAAVSPFSDSKLESIHAELADDESSGLDGFQFVQHCPGNRNRWQIGFDTERNDAYYFLVEEQNEHSFRMIDVSRKRQPGCPGEDKPRQIGDKYPTLFPAAKKP